MKHILLTTLIVTSFGLLTAQNLTDLKTQQAEKIGYIADLQAQIDAAQGEVDAIQDEINKLSGWRKGISGIVGFDWNRSKGWVANPNPESRATSLNFDLTGYLLNDREKTFWHNKANVVKAWNDVDSPIDDNDNIGLFDSGTIDLLNVSSLAGYKISEQVAISGQAELITSNGNFIMPGTFDLGVGVTWLPIENLTVMVHPLNMNVAFPSKLREDLGYNTSFTFGAKARVDYFQDFVILGKDVNWNSTLTAYLPYTSLDEVPATSESVAFTPKVNNYTWLNNFSFEIWRGIGVGLGWGLRKADFESDDLQAYSNVGLSYNIK